MSVDVLCHRFPSKTQPSFRSLLVFRTRLTSQAQSRQFHKLTHLFSYDCWGMFAIANVACVSVSWHSHFPPLSSLPGLQLVCQREKATEEHGAAAGPELGAQNQTLQQVCSGQRRKAQHQQRRQLLRRYGGDSPPSLYTAGSTRVKLQMWETHNPPASQLCDQNRRVPSSSRPRCLCVWFIGFFFFFSLKHLTHAVVCDSYDYNPWCEGKKSRMQSNNHVESKTGLRLANKMPQCFTE